MSEEQAEYTGWAILELMGRRRLIGYIREVTIAGGAFLRIDVLTSEGENTQYYACGAIYAITPTTEETAKRAASLSQVAPISRWELPSPPSHRGYDELDEIDQQAGQALGADLEG